MSSFISKTVGRFLLPNLEKDLTKAVHQSLRSSESLTNCFLPPAVYGFEKQLSVGIGRSTNVLEKRIATATTSPKAMTFEKVHYKAPVGGLFQ